MAAIQSESMDRGSAVLKAHLSDTSKMEIRQTRRGWLQECLACEAKTEFKYFIDETQVAHSLEDTDCFCRMCCAPIHPFKMNVKELNTEASLLEVDRPLRCAAGVCKCCCYQEATVTSGSDELGTIKETCAYCVPEYEIYDHTGKGVYRMHPPTCCGGCCVNCCTEGNPCCGKGCCKVPFHIFDYEEKDTAGNENYIGKILKKPKSLMTEMFTDSNAFDVDFPKDATPAQKGMLIGSAIFMNAIYFEGEE